MYERLMWQSVELAPFGVRDLSPICICNSKKRIFSGDADYPQLRSICTGRVQPSGVATSCHRFDSDWTDGDSRLRKWAIWELASEFEHSHFFGLGDLLLVNHPLTQAEQIVTQGINHRATENADHHGRGDGDPGRKHAPEHGSGQVQ